MIEDDVEEAVEQLGLVAAGLYLHLARRVNKAGVWRTSMPQIARCFRCPENHVRRAVQTLESAGFLERHEVKTERGLTVGVEFTLPYHGRRLTPIPPTVTPPTDPHSDPPNTRARLNGTEVVGEVEKKSRERTARVLPDDFDLSPERLAYAVAQGMTDRLARLAFQRFTNYWRSEGKTKKDWEATWRNWVLSDVARMTERQGGIAGSTPDYATDPEGYKAHRTALAERSRV